MRAGQRSQALKVVLTVAFAVALGAPVKADDATTAARLGTKSEGKLFTAIQSTFRAGWFGNQLRFEKHSGLEFRRPLSVGGRDCTFALQGPMVGRGAYGLSFELRF